MTTLVELSKAVRPYDPEDKRQRNSGILPGLAGGGAIATGAQTARQFERTDMRTMGRRLKNMEAPVRVRSDMPSRRLQETNRSVQNRARAYKQRGAATQATSGKPLSRTWYIDDVGGKKGSAQALRSARRKSAGKWGAATVGLAGLSALTAARAGSRKNRRWE